MQDIREEQLRKKIAILSTRRVHANEELFKKELEDAEALAVAVLKDREYENPIAKRLAADISVFAGFANGVWARTGCNSEDVCGRQHILENNLKHQRMSFETYREACSGSAKRCSNESCIFSKSYKATPSVTADDLIFGGHGSYRPHPYAS